MKPYFDENGITIYCGDCRELWFHLHLLEKTFQKVGDDGLV